MNPIKDEPVVLAVTVLLAAAGALLIAFGVHLTDVQIGAVTQFAEAAFGVAFLVRAQVTPKAHKPDPPAAPSVPVVTVTTAPQVPALTATAPPPAPGSLSAQASTSIAPGSLSG